MKPSCRNSIIENLKLIRHVCILLDWFYDLRSIKFLIRKKIIIIDFYNKLGLCSNLLRIEKSKLVKKLSIVKNIKYSKKISIVKK